MTTTSERFLITGALGCLGSWVVRELLEEGVDVVAYDRGGDDYRLRYLLDAETLSRVIRVKGDIRDSAALREAVHSMGATNVIHLAALQTPASAADPATGAAINVAGTINVFEAVKNSSAAEHPLVYASSVAVHANSSDSCRRTEPADWSSSHYGVFKRANEGNAHVFFENDNISSVGVRPYVVYGVGRDQGMTATATAAMLAAARDESYTITFTGPCQMHYAQDAAKALIAAARSDAEGASVLDLGGPVSDVHEIIAAIGMVAPEGAKKIGASGHNLPFPPGMDAPSVPRYLEGISWTPLSEGVAETITRFHRLIETKQLREVRT